MPQWISSLPQEFWQVLAEMSPYLLFGFFCAGLLSLLVSPELVERHLGGRGFWPVIKASAIGVPLPLCSCGVIPVAASLRRNGASRGSTLAFLISTPQTGVDSIFATFSLMGLTFAIFRPIAALISGLLGGMLVDTFDHKEPPGKPLPATASAAAACEIPGAGSKLRRAFTYGFGTLPGDIGRSLLIGLGIAALLASLIPADYFAGSVGGGIGAMLLMMLIGIPVYVCATASVPVAAMLIHAGISPGAALVFLMTGPATNAATIATVWKVLGRRSAIIYLLSIAATSLASGITLDYILHLQGNVTHAGMGAMLPPAVNNTCAVLLLAVLLRAVLWPYVASWFKAPKEFDMSMTRIRIEGMTCSHCASSVEKALLQCAGVTGAKVNLAAARADVSGEGLNSEQMRQAVEGLGFKVLPGEGT